MLSALIIQLQGIVGEVMILENALNPPIIDGHVVAVPDNLRQLAQRERMGDCEPDDLLLDMVG